MERWKPTDADMVRLTLHRTWFTWPAWVCFAIIEDQRYYEMLDDMIREGSRRTPR